jgi:lysophospholipase L1-like esterase
MLKYLALGDSYTIGEQVISDENFPNQFVQSNKHLNFDKPKIIATTGWTTNELIDAITKENDTNQYDLVTLLIGVNNQYRDYPIDQYRKEFTHLLNTAIEFANDNKQVVVLSIPDWGVTPFASDYKKSALEIGAEIDAYNSIAKTICDQHQIHWIDITESTRIHGKDSNFLTPDLLHYSAMEYKIWADKITQHINQQKLF